MPGGPAAEAGGAEGWPLALTLSNGKTFGADLLVGRSRVVGSVVSVYTTVYGAPYGAPRWGAKSGWRVDGGGGFTPGCMWVMWVRQLRVGSNHGLCVS